MNYKRASLYHRIFISLNNLQPIPLAHLSFGHSLHASHSQSVVPIPGNINITRELVRYKTSWAYSIRNAESGAHKSV